MKCPFCSSSNTKVVDKRKDENLGVNKRRRECLKCGRRFTTFEKVEVEDIVVIKKDGRREPFSREKIKRGVIRACEKLPVSYKTIENLVDEVEKKVRELGQEEIATTVIGDLVMEKLKKINEVAYVRFASYYKSFTDIVSFQKSLENLNVIEEKEVKDSTDIHLFVSATTQGVTSKWNKQKIIDALINEANLSKEDAEEIATAVEKKVLASGIRTINVNLIRELVDNELFERGLGKKLEKQQTIGIPSFNLNQIIYTKSNENSNITANNPEAVNFEIAEIILKQYALKEIFSKDVADAHLTGAIHIHNLGMPIRVYCSAHSPEYLKKYGLRLLNLSTASTPAKYAGTLTGHINTFLASMQAYYAGALGLAYVNIFYAPLLDGYDYKRIKQEAQYLIFSCSQSAFSRGGQTLFIDFNIHLGVPSYLRNIPAIGPGGKYMHKMPDGSIKYLDEVPRDENGNLKQPEEGRILTYSDFEKEAQEFAKALMEVWMAGDSDGKPFPFPKFNLHINADVFNDPKQYELFKFACKVAAKNGATYFVFDREDATLSQCCRLKTKITDNYMIQHPESMRFCGFLNVTVNLPQAAYRAGGDLEKTIEEIKKTMDIVAKAHIQKKNFIRKISSQPGMPLWQIGMPGFDGRPYVDLDNVTHIIGLIGLNECVKRITGMELHESDEAYKTGLKIISAMYFKCKELEKKLGMKFSLEETPAESTSLRLAKIDLERFPEAKNYVRGNQETGEIYYTNSVHFAPDAPISIIERIEKQGRFNSIIESGSITHLFVGEHLPDAESIANLVRKTWENTQSAQIVFSPEFTVCDDCKRVYTGFRRDKENKCKFCGSENIYGISRVVGYYSIIGGKVKGKEFEGWIKSKQAEFRDRQKGDYGVLNDSKNILATRMS
ncbi:MAG: anaerobic ribonucleoside-triphosphate reductase [Candidatus Aenigmatarchaeota archaeon]